MKTIKIAAGLACGLTILLLVLISASEDPEATLFKETIELLMKQEGLASVRETKARFPELTEVQDDLERISALSQLLLRKGQSPAPNLSEGEQLQMNHHARLIRELRKGVRRKLSRLVVARAGEQP